MSTGPDDLSGIGLLFAECLERVEQEGQQALETMCTEHPDDADELRRRLAQLRDLGLVDRGRMGHYRLLRTLGVGGMGVVYLAHDERLDRLVALKVLPDQLALNPRAVDRFEREVRAVARLAHERIVPVFDVGRVEGVPFFTMERVDGETLAELLELLRASGRAPGELHPADVTAIVDCEARSYVDLVCRLMLDVADALQHAHEHDIVHRDVKPSNVLVRPDGHALLFDFGLARIDDGLGLTRSGDFTGTPAYMSPEQLAGKPDRVDRRTDVYSLGATLYELLTLRQAHAAETPQDQMERILRDDPPPPRALNPMVPRDLETVCLRALEKDPDRRYQGAGEFADDLRRFLALEPVHARPIGPGARLLRRARRRPAATLALLLSLLVVVGAPVGLWSANQAIRAERDLAERRLGEASRVNDLLMAILSAPAPQLDGREVRVVDVLDRASALLDEALEDDPRVELTLRTVLGHSYRALGRTEQAVAAYEAAHRLATDPQDRALTLTHLGVIRAETGALDEAVDLLGQACDAWRGLDDGPGIEQVQALNSLGAALAIRGDLEQAAVSLQEAADLLQRLPSADRRLLVEVQTNLCLLLDDSGRDDESLGLYEETAALAREVLEPSDPVLATLLSNHGSLLAERGELPRGVALLEEALVVLRGSLGDADPRVAKARVKLATVLLLAERNEQAADQARQALAVLEPVDPRGALAALAQHRLGAALLALGQPAEAFEPLRQAVELGKVLSWEERWSALVDLSRLLVMQGDGETADALLDAFAGEVPEAAERLAALRAERE